MGEARFACSPALGIRVAFDEIAGKEIAERVTEEDDIAREGEDREKEPEPTFKGHGHKHPSDEGEGGSDEYAEDSRLFHAPKVCLRRQGSPERDLNKF
jgi:hypothetical protein